MNILFLTLVAVADINEHSLYADLLRCFAENGHSVYIASATEKREEQNFYQSGTAKILRVYVGKFQKTGKIQKGISTLFMESRFGSAIKRKLPNVKFDLVLYSTPPITFEKTVRFLKKRDTARAYLLLKDIFPQNAIDLGMLRQDGFLTRYFRAKEKKLYEHADQIGCMSQANADYLLAHNSYISPAKVHVNPNSISPLSHPSKSEEERRAGREKFGLPMDKKIFVYGGNFGMPQDVPFIVECLKTQLEKDDRYFVFCGAGTDYPILENFIANQRPQNIKALPFLSREEFAALLRVCDFGLIFLAHRFTIPNFPSRLLSYMEAGLPVLCATDKATDIGKTVADGGFGFYCESKDVGDFARLADEFCTFDESTLSTMRENAYNYLLKNFTAKKSYEIIIGAIA